MMTQQAPTGRQMIEELQRRMTRLEAEVKQLKTSGGGGGSRAVGNVDLDSPLGNPEVRRDPNPKYWDGDSFVGCSFSECTPEYLDAVSKYREASAYMKDQEGGADNEKYARYDRLDAARARGWAERLRSGWQPKAAVIPGRSEPPAELGRARLFGGDYSQPQVAPAQPPRRNAMPMPPRQTPQLPMPPAVEEEDPWNATSAPAEDDYLDR